MTSPASNLHNIRVDAELWSAATAATAANGTNVSAIIRELLAEYVARSQPARLADAVAEVQRALDALRELVTP